MMKRKLKADTSQPQLTIKEESQLEIDNNMKLPDPEVQVINESGLVHSFGR